MFVRWVEVGCHEKLRCDLIELDEMRGVMCYLMSAG